MRPIIREVLHAARRNRILAGVVATTIALLVILLLLEISYREELDREISAKFTGSLLSSPPVDPSKITKIDYPRWTPLVRPTAALAPPPPANVAQPSSAEPTQRPTQGAVVARDPVPLPRSRPNRS